MEGGTAGDGNGGGGMAFGGDNDDRDFAWPKVGRLALEAWDGMWEFPIKFLKNSETIPFFAAAILGPFSSGMPYFAALLFGHQ